MGIDINGIKSFNLMKKKNIIFSDVATFGRQGIHIRSYEILKYIKDLSKDDLNKIKNIKINDYAEDLIKILGANSVESFDFSDYEKATHIWDMNIPIDIKYKNKYDLVFDGGTLEHIFNFPVAIKNAMEMVKVGGHFLSITCCNNFSGHGFYQFSPELFFRIFTKENGFELDSIYISENNNWYQVTDPELVKSRVIFKNSKETYIIILAKKIENKDIFSINPYQSDYLAIWGEGERKIKYTFIKKVLRKLNYICNDIFIKYNKQYFKKIKI